MSKLPSYKKPVHFREERREVEKEKMKEEKRKEGKGYGKEGGKKRRKKRKGIKRKQEWAALETSVHTRDTSLEPLCSEPQHGI